MSFTTVQFGKYISFAVMLLMFVALAAGQAGATMDAGTGSGAEAINISVEVAADPDQFRSEDE